MLRGAMSCVCIGIDLSYRDLDLVPGLPRLVTIVYNVDGILMI